MAKLRFIKDDSLVVTEYIKYCPSYFATKIIAIRLITCPKSRITIQEDSALFEKR